MALRPRLSCSLCRFLRFGLADWPCPVPPQDPFPISEAQEMSPLFVFLLCFTGGLVVGLVVGIYIGTRGVRVLLAEGKRHDS